MKRKAQKCEHCGMDLPATHLGRAIRRAGYTFTVFAERFNVPRPTLAGWASVGYMPHQRYRKLICEATGITEEQLRKPFADGRYDEPEET